MGQRLQLELVALVYQAGIANVFGITCHAAVDEPKCGRWRILQGDFRTCEMFVRGMKHAGVEVVVAACNWAGDVSTRPWDTPLDCAPFREAFDPTLVDRRRTGVSRDGEV